jgi:hypothetical protein
MVNPTLTEVAPLIVANELATMFFEVAQPVDNVYSIVVTPPDTAVTMPDEDPTVNADVLLLVHVPPEGELDKVALEPTHTAKGPTISDGNALTVTIAVTTVLDGNV